LHTSYQSVTSIIKWKQIARKNYAVKIEIQIPG
jgi:hypothetical protein